MRLRPDTKVVERKYLFYFVKTQQFISTLSSKAIGEAHSLVTDSDIRQIELPMPDLYGQRKVVEILDQANYIRTSSDEAKKKSFSILSALFYEFSVIQPSIENFGRRFHLKNCQLKLLKWCQ